MWWKYAKPGDKVVRVADGPPSNEWVICFPDSKYPEKGKVYTIRSIIVTQQTVCFRLQEIINPDRRLSGYLPADDGSYECAYAATGFRPVKSTETGMTILRGLLAPIKENA